MKLSSLICCENIKQDSDSRIILQNPLQVFEILNILSTFSFYIFVGLLDLDKNEQEALSIKNEDPKGKIIKEIGSSLVNVGENTL